jgi:protein gp37
LGVAPRTIARLRAIYATDAAGRLKHPALVARLLEGEAVVPVYEAIPRPVAPPTPKLFTVEAWTALSPARRRRVIDEALKSGADGGFNRQSNDSIDWAFWSWNPVTGCLHNCDYCYARDIAKRFYSEVSEDENERFAPVFRPERLVAPANSRPGSSDPYGRDRNVFVCSMADLFGKWVPQEWIEAVFDQVKAHSEWRFLFLTKFPQRLAELAWPDNAWCGTTVDRQDRVKVAEKAFRDVKAGVRWLSCEPMLEPLKFSSLDMFNRLVIGASTASSQTPEFQPPAAWVRDLWQQAEQAGCGVYLKRNLRCISDLPQ